MRAADPRYVGLQDPAVINEVAVVIEVIRDACFVVIVSLCAVAAAASGDVRRRYLVGTDGPGWAFEGLPRGERSFVAFRHVDAFAVELTDAELLELAKRDDVRYIEPDAERHALGLTRAHATRLGPGPRSLDDEQIVPYGVTLVEAPPAWSVTRGAGVKVGVIDTGIDLDHPDLIERYKGGLDFVNGGAIPRDDNGHGTHVAGTIAASDNDFGVVGVAPEVDLYALKVLSDTGGGSALNVIRAIEWAIDNQLDVVNLSLGGAAATTTEEDAFDMAVEAGVVCVAASGNKYPDAEGVDYPSAYPSVIAVGALDADRVVADFSQRGVSLELMGPGVRVKSTFVVSDAYRISSDAFNDVLSNGMAYSGQPASVSGDLVLCGLGKPEDFPAGVAGSVALISRGELSFNEKTRNAQAAGAIAAIVYNDEPGGFSGTVCGAGQTCAEDPILAVSVSREDAQSTLLPHVGSRVTMTKTRVSTYELIDGTSMATPHVAGIVALLRGLVPDATPAEIRTALETTARDLGEPGFDTTYGWGLADAWAAGWAVAPGLFQPYGPPDRKRGVRRP